MKISKYAGRLALGLSMSASVTAIATAMEFNVPGGDLEAALNAYSAQSGVQLMVSSEAVRGIRTQGIKGDLPSDVALSRILSGTGFVSAHDVGGGLTIVKGTGKNSSLDVQPLQLAQASPAPRTAVETVTVTSSKLGGADVQSIPIAITALSQEQLTATQTAGGPDLIKQVPNMTFTKTNFSGYSIQLRGIGTQAISVTTDPAVAVAFNDQPFLRNHFFEQEFFDVSQVEVLRGPQGTLYGRNATAGVVNITSARPTDQFEAMASAEIGNYSQRRFEGMLNLPIVDDRVALRFAGEWTKRDGYSFNELTGERIDGRNLWSGRMTIGFRPIESLQTYLIWEHFQENDGRMRSSKQLCKTDQVPSEIGGRTIPNPDSANYASTASRVTQGCEAASLYAPESFQVPNGIALPYYGPTKALANAVFERSPYVGVTQSQNLRVIESSLDPVYKAKNDTLLLNADYSITPALTFTSQTGFNNDFIWATQDYNRFNSLPGAFDVSPELIAAGIFTPEGKFCDPQIGCSDRLVLQDLSSAKSWQASQEFRLASKFSGPFNFSLGGNYLHYETYENYYVFINSITLWGTLLAPINRADNPYVSGVSDNYDCLQRGPKMGDPTVVTYVPGPGSCMYIDPNPLTSLNNKGHNYFLSQNPYVLNSYAAFGEAYYDIAKDLKLTGGLRWTQDRKHAPQIPSELVVSDVYGYPALSPVDQQWDELTDRLAVNWTPDLDFTDQTLIYSSYAHGYKAGGANPPPPVFIDFEGNGLIGQKVLEVSAAHPTSFKPEFVDAFELGSKNTLMDGALTLNLSAFYYDYKGYQISQIVDRTAVNQNFDTKVKGAEIEGMWEPLPGLRFNFAGGWEHTELAKGSQAIDLMDRTAGNPDWIVWKPFPTQPSNCIMPVYVFVAGGDYSGFCTIYKVSSKQDIDPYTLLPYKPYPDVKFNGDPVPADYPGFKPTMAPNNGEGFYKDLSGNELPNAPRFTVTLGAQYSMPLSSEWAGTLRTDYYWQDYSWARVINADPYDRLRGYTNVNLSLIFTSQNGWQVMLYDKNVFNTTAITGAFLNSDDSGLTTNVFLTDPKLIGIRVTKNW